MPQVSEHEDEIAGLPVFWRQAPVADARGAVGDGGTGAGPAVGEGGAGSERAVPLYLHGVPTNSDDWVAFLARGGGVAPDLPGFGRSGKPGSRTYTVDEYADFVEAFLERREIERVSLVVHDWGAVGLAFAQRHPQRVERVVVIDAVPLLAGFRWHRTARIWRTPVLGELLMGSTSRRMLRLLSREANATPGPMPEHWLDTVLDHFDQGTQRAILRLYRSSPPDALAAAGARLGEIGAPALVVWGTRDPYIPARFAQAYAKALGGAELMTLDDAGHWPWLDRPEVIDRVVEFVTAAPR
jgi:pimeloyl-ACP methyl ester carboxylesterase